MIEAITGKVGSGKTLYAITDMASHILQGGCVCANILPDRDHIARWCWKRGHRFRDAQWVELPMDEDPVFFRYMRQAAPGSKLKVKVFIDEAHLFFPAAEHSTMRKEFKAVESFVSQSRRVGCDIYFITQAWENVWGALRKQALFEICCRDFRVVSLPLVGDSLGSMIGLKWTRVDCASGASLETGTTSLDRGIFGFYSTLQPYNEEMAEIMRMMPVYQEQRERVPILQRWFASPPPREIQPLETESCEFS